MDKIYSHAELTIVAAAGDAYHGLPGVNGLARTVGRELCLGNRNLDEICSPSGQIESSKWATRAWTFQEGSLSRRRLFFTEKGVVFWCRPTYREENIFCSLPASGEIEHDFSPISEVVPVHWAALNQASPLSVISEYSSRKMAYEKDTLNACLGILTALKATHFWGIPVRFNGSTTYPDVSDNLEDTYRSGMLSELQNLAPAHYKMELAWHNMSHTRPVECKAFPTWSWTRWTGRKFFNGEREQGRNSSIIAIEIQLPNKEWVDILRNNSPQGNLGDVSPGKTLRITGRTVKPRFLTKDGEIYIVLQSISCGDIFIRTNFDGDHSAVRGTLEELHSVMALELESLRKVGWQDIEGIFLLVKHRAASYRRIGLVSPHSTFDVRCWDKAHHTFTYNPIEHFEKGPIELAGTEVQTIYIE